MLYVEFGRNHSASDGQVFPVTVVLQRASVSRIVCIVSRRMMHFRCRSRRGLQFHLVSLSDHPGLSAYSRQSFSVA